MAREIDIIALRQITNAIFDHIIEVLNIRSVELTHDMYWSVSPEDMFNMTREPSSFGVGQLYDDLDFLNKILTDREQASPAMMMHLAPLLNYLSTQVKWYKAR